MDMYQIAPRYLPLETRYGASSVKDVWQHNCIEEIKKISSLIEEYRIVAFDTEFPGIPISIADPYQDQQYQAIRANVDQCKVIQIGITLCNENGVYPPGTASWQFNFKFNLDENMYSEDSIRLLKDSGIDFQLFKEKGIDFQHFAQYFVVSGLPLNDEITWVTFHCCYDFAYLLKYITMESLPQTCFEFLDTLDVYFPHFYDLKHMVQQFDYMRGSLKKLAEEMSVVRTGPSHQAGNDSLVTLETFIRVRDYYFGRDGIQHFKNVVFSMSSPKEREPFYYDLECGMHLPLRTNM